MKIGSVVINGLSKENSYDVLVDFKAIISYGDSDKILCTVQNSTDNEFEIIRPYNVTLIPRSHFTGLCEPSVPVSDLLLSDDDLDKAIGCTINQISPNTIIYLKKFI